MNTITLARGDTGLWNPIRGTCFNSLNAPTDTVRQEAVAVLSKSLNPQGPVGQRTGLVIGYVQSGKTSSFTTVAALARDNGYQLVIVISGTSTPLYRQSASRVIGELLEAEPNGWVPIRSDEIRPKNLDHHVQTIGRSLRFWQAQGIAASNRKTILITVMKNAHHLDALQQVLQQVDLTGVPALVIDDEAHQASLNFAATGESGIYSRLRQLRQLLPHITYLQYTATPQAPLLIRLDYALSPEFCKVLSAGSSFTGPARFFDQDAALLVKEITQKDLNTAGAGTAPTALMSSLAIYFLGVAAHLTNPEESGVNNRTMMVHPSQRCDPHEDYRAFVEGIIDRWKRALQTRDATELAAMRGTFQRAFDDLSRTVTTVTFDELWAQVPNALDLTIIEIMHGRLTGTRQPNWALPYHIIIGGEMLGVGVTVEGLTVTYMPRALGTGNADTIQQRARWFGYKERYIGFCRVWLPRASIDAYQAILEHEEHMRNSLRAHPGPLNEWRRKFFLDPALRPTRHQVVRLDLARGTYNGGFFSQKAPTGAEPSVTERNQALLAELFAGETFQPFGRPEWTDTQKGEIARNVPLSKVNEFLQSYAPENESDSTRLIGLAMQTTEYEKDNPNTTCSIVKMSSSNGVWTERTRTVERLHQGPSPAYQSGANPNAYSGDQERHTDDLTIQVFMMRNGAVGMIPAIAAWVPTEMARHWMVEER
jgi:hypothetical protein